MLIVQTAWKCTVRENPQDPRHWLIGTAGDNGHASREFAPNGRTRLAHAMNAPQGDGAWKESICADAHMWPLCIPRPNQSISIGFAGKSHWQKESCRIISLLRPDLT